jgi:hypothetical protein
VVAAFLRVVDRSERALAGGGRVAAERQ